ncbi:DUF1491 family protein [Alphaproteobacteria bacterium]|jgi:hypothetical protein|nr:DUF1491 family protein [Alphaproteobacteria bacterium]
MARLTTAMLVAGVMAEANQERVTMVLEKRGDKERGAIIVRLESNDGMVRVESRHHDPDYGAIWSAIHQDDRVTSMQAAELVEKQISYDADCWVVAVETPHGINPFAQYDKATILE